MELRFVEPTFMLANFLKTRINNTGMNKTPVNSLILYRFQLADAVGRFVYAYFISFFSLKFLFKNIIKSPD